MLIGFDADMYVFFVEIKISPCIAGKGVVIGDCTARISCDSEKTQNICRIINASTAGCNISHYGGECTPRVSPNHDEVSTNSRGATST